MKDYTIKPSMYIYIVNISIFSMHFMYILKFLPIIILSIGSITIAPTYFEGHFNIFA